MTGPEGTLPAPTETSAPTTEAAIPKAPASRVIAPREFVHCRAATAGKTTYAMTSTRPTDFNPMTTATTVAAVTVTSTSPMGRPRTRAASGSKTKSWTSRHSSRRAASAAPAKAAETRMSDHVTVEALPNR